MKFNTLMAIAIFTIANNCGWLRYDIGFDTKVLWLILIALFLTAFVDLIKNHVTFVVND